ncbi:M15 family metallopeptidase [Deinococcus oregonensis]|uniref:M15 family metallopeptidase n=1 Tax=Deinococcus oregonensis TaxID=1805970 RepID=A0ABV6B6G1_9DEIO
MGTNRNRPLSVHAFAAAIDFDAALNGYGLPLDRMQINREVVRIFSECGWEWGGYWTALGKTACTSNGQTVLRGCSNRSGGICGPRLFRLTSRHLPQRGCCPAQQSVHRDADRDGIQATVPR